MEYSFAKICLRSKNGKWALPWVILNYKPYKMLPNQFPTSISILLEVVSKLAAFQLPVEPFKEHPGTHRDQIGHSNTPWGKQTKEEWTGKELSVVS